MPPFNILLVEDDPVQVLEISSMLNKIEKMNQLDRKLKAYSPWQIISCDQISQALEWIKKIKFELILLDFQLSDGIGLDLLEKVSSDIVDMENTSIVMLSAYSNTSRVVRALKLGACDFLEKPLSLLKLKVILESYAYQKFLRNKHALYNLCDKSVVQKNNEKTNSIVNQFSQHIVMSENSSFVETLKLGTLVSNKSCPIFLNGESGTGKELLAKYIHDSGSLKGSFIPINCGALSENLIESDFFGHKRGAFTGADSDHQGCFLDANEGTLFLDEIGELPLSIQTRLLRVLQEKKVRPLGESQEYPVSFRLISATHRDLQSLVSEGLFREDLYYRICVFPIELPPLRNRPDDLPLLVEYFLEQYDLEKSEIQQWKQSFPSEWVHYSWPGNIRELKNLVDRLMVLKELGQGWVDARSLSEGINNVPSDKERIVSKNKREIGEKEIVKALQENQYHREKTARSLGISRRTLQYRLARMG